MKYYIGYFNKPWNDNEFTVLAICPSIYAARFILESYNESDKENYPNHTDSGYRMLTATEIMDKKLVF